METPAKDTQPQAAIESELAALQATSPRRDVPAKRTPSSNAALRTPSFTLSTPSQPRVLSPQFQPPRPSFSSKRSRTAPAQEGWPVWMAKAPDVVEGESPGTASASVALASTLPAESEAAAVTAVAPTSVSTQASMAAATTLQHAQSGCYSAASLPAWPAEREGLPSPKRRLEKRSTSWLPPRILTLTGGLRPSRVSAHKPPHRPKQLAKESAHSRPSAAAGPAAAAPSGADAAAAAGAAIDAGRGPGSAAISAGDDEEARP